MSVFAVDRMLHRLHDRAVWARFQEQPDAVLADAELTPEEARALASGDLAALYRLGANGYLLLGFAHQAGSGDFREAIRALGDAPAARTGG